MTSEERSALNRRNVHRMMAAATLVAFKFLEDRPMRMSYYARVVGVDDASLRSLEREFCSLIDFRLSLEGTAYQELLEYYDMPAF